MRSTNSLLERIGICLEAWHALFVTDRIWKTPSIRMKQLVFNVTPRLLLLTRRSLWLQIRTLLHTMVIARCATCNTSRPWITVISATVLTLGKFPKDLQRQTEKSVDDFLVFFNLEFSEVFTKGRSETVDERKTFSVDDFLWIWTQFSSALTAE